jgi:hydroxymethylpyrimidine/phosphomethylpyrimidine kinase
MQIPASVVSAQMDAAFSDAPCDAVKTGMLASIDIVYALVDRIGRWGSASRLIIDPVLTSTSGRSLLPEDARLVLLEKLVPACALITPNLPEASLLTGVPISGVEDMGLAADHLLARGAAAVLIKGGHLVDLDPEIEEITDLLRTADGEEFRFTHARQKGPGFRGTGCTLASAIAAFVAEGLTLHSAVQKACDYVEAAMKAAEPYRAFRGLAHGAGLVARG